MMIRSSGSIASSTGSQKWLSVAAPIASTRLLSPRGITWTSLARARTEASATPLTAPWAADRRAIARATASSSSSSNGGIAAPDASW